MTTSFIFNPFTSNFDAVTTSLTPAEIVGGGTNTVAGFDSAGVLESIPGWSIDTNSGGIYSAITFGPTYNFSTPSIFSDNSIIQSGATISGSLVSYGAYPTIDSGAALDSYAAININPTVNEQLDNLQGIGISAQINANINNASVAYSGLQVNSGADITNFSGFNENTQYHSGSSLSNFHSSYLSNPVFDSGSTIANFTSYQAGPLFNTDLSSISLMQIGGSGSGTATNVTGLSINLSSINSVGRKVGVQVNDGIININAAIESASSLFVDAANTISTQINVVNGSPLTGTTVLGLNGSALFNSNDNFAAGPLGVSASAIGFVGQGFTAAGKTVDGISMALSGIQLGGDGTITDLVLYDAIGSITSGTGTPVVTNQYMFRGHSLTSGIPTNSWGLSIEDATAENYFKKSLAIDVSTKKVSNASVGLEIGGTTKALRLPVLTTTQRDALTALDGMQIFNTTTDQVEFYDGASWTTGTSAGAITSLTGDVTATGPGAAAATIANLTVTNAKIANATIDLTTKVTGVLPEANGGTHQSTYATGDILYASASNTLSKRTIGSTGNVLTVSGGVPIWAPSTATAPNSVIRLDGFTGTGSSNTQVFRFTTITDSAGTDLTLTQSSTAGDSITVNTTGLYSMDMRVTNSLLAQGFGISRNSTVGISPTANACLVYLESNVNNVNMGASGTKHLDAGDVIRGVNYGSGGTPIGLMMAITRIG